MEKERLVTFGHVFFDVLVIIALFLPITFKLPVELFFVLTIITLFYTMVAVKSPDNGGCLPGLLYAFSLIGIAAIIVVVTTLAMGLMAAVLMLILFLAFALSKLGDSINVFSKIYHHPSRYLIFPFVFTLFLLSGEQYIIERMPSDLVVLVVLGMYIPFRILAFWGEKETGIERFFKFVSIIFAVNALFISIRFSPQSPVWSLLGMSEFYGKESVVWLKDVESKAFIPIKDLLSQDSIYHLIELRIGREIKVTLYEDNSDKENSESCRFILAEKNSFIVKKKRTNSFFETINPTPQELWEIDYKLTMEYSKSTKTYKGIGSCIRYKK